MSQTKKELPSLELYDYFDKHLGKWTDIDVALYVIGQALFLIDRDLSFHIGKGHIMTNNANSRDIYYYYLELVDSEFLLVNEEDDFVMLNRH